MNPALNSSARHDWRTPRWLVDRIHEVFGGITIDPCAPGDRSNPCRAHVLFRDGQRDGLAESWGGREGLVYVNPPYGRELPRWVDKANEELDCEILLLTPARTDTAWFHALAGAADGVTFCFLRGRLTFEGAPASAPFPSLLSYMGPREKEFRDGFADLGWVP